MEDQEFSDDERRHLRIVKDRVYWHQVLRINYTTYDMRRDQDSVNPRTHTDVMVLATPASEDAAVHPYLYARVCDIFYVEVRHTFAGVLSDSQKVEVLWVRWLTPDLTGLGGFGKRKLTRVGFVSAEVSGAFGFLDPSRVIRGVHLIPAFAHGRTDRLLRGPSRSG